jgi:hypothetical protein
MTHINMCSEDIPRGRSSKVCPIKKIEGIVFVLVTVTD